MAVTGATIRSRSNWSSHQLGQMLHLSGRLEQPKTDPHRTLRRTIQPALQPQRPAAAANQQGRHLRDQMFQHLFDGFTPPGRMLECPMGPEQWRRLVRARSARPVGPVPDQAVAAREARTARPVRRAAGFPIARSAQIPNWCSSATTSSLSRSSSIGNGRRAAAVSPAGITQVPSPAGRGLG